MNGGTMTSALAAPTVTAGWTVQSAGDFNGDGKADLVLRQSSTGDVAVWLLDGAGHTLSSGTWGMTTDWLLQK
jgi:hypothetical protein